MKIAIVKLSALGDIIHTMVALQFIKKQGFINIDLNEVIDKKIIGGAILKIEDKRLDASLSTKIKNLKQSFNKNLYLQDF